MPKLYSTTTQSTLPFECAPQVHGESLSQDFWLSFMPSTLYLDSDHMYSTDLESPRTARSPTVVHTGLHQLGCLSAENTQHGFTQRFEQRSYQHMLQKQLVEKTSLQSYHVAEMLSACQWKELETVKCLQ